MENAESAGRLKMATWDVTTSRKKSTEPLPALDALLDQEVVLLSPIFILDGGPG